MHTCGSTKQYGRSRGQKAASKQKQQPSDDETSHMQRESNEWNHHKERKKERSMQEEYPNFSIISSDKTHRKESKAAELMQDLRGENEECESCKMKRSANAQPPI